MKELASPGGPLWPIDLTDPTQRETVAKRLAMQRLTGMLFSPAVPADFDWTPDSFRSVTPAEQLDKLPKDFKPLVELEVAAVLEEDFGGSLERLLDATDDEKAKAWYAFGMRWKWSHPREPLVSW